MIKVERNGQPVEDVEVEAGAKYDVINDQITETITIASRDGIEEFSLSGKNSWRVADAVREGKTARLIDVTGKTYLDFGNRFPLTLRHGF